MNADEYKLIIFDKDGTLVEPRRGSKWVTSYDDQQFMPNVQDILIWLHAQGVQTAIATNQGGVAQGHKSLGTAIDELVYAMNLTGIGYGSLAPSYEADGRGEAVIVSTEEYLPPMIDMYARDGMGELRFVHITDSGNLYRKPNDGMLYNAIDSHVVLPSQVLYVGDRAEDKAAADNGGIAFSWANDFFNR